MDYKGHPKPVHIEWYDPQNRIIPTSSSDGKYVVDTKESVTLLTIRSPELPDAGNYTVKAHNNLVEESKQFQLIVEGEGLKENFDRNIHTYIIFQYSIDQVYLFIFKLNYWRFSYLP